VKQQLHQLVLLPYHGHYGKLWTSQKLCDVCYTRRQYTLVFFKKNESDKCRSIQAGVRTLHYTTRVFQTFLHHRPLQKALKLPRHSFLSRNFTISIKLLLLSSFLAFYAKYTNSVALVSEQTLPTERPPLVGEVSANF
jgi:hypothetical protein